MLNKPSAKPYLGMEFSDAEGNPVGAVPTTGVGVWTRIPPSIAEKIVQLATPPWTNDMLLDGRVVALARITEGDEQQRIDYYIGTYDDALAMGWAGDELSPPSGHRIGLVGKLTVNTQILRADGTIEC